MHEIALSGAEADQLINQIVPDDEGDILDGLDYNAKANSILQTQSTKKILKDAPLVGGKVNEPQDEIVPEG